MKIDINLSDGRKSTVVVGESIDNLSDYAGNRKITILTDRNVYALYKDRFPECRVIIMPGGEKNKTLATVQSVVAGMIDAGVDRSGYVVGIGGGIVCDLTGFIASVYMRGVGFGFVSSTLLSQVDASVGGKNGVNCEGYKNMIGVFNQPDFVICDIDMLGTLPEREFRSGLAEVVKTALIADADLFRFIEEHVDDVRGKDTITDMVYRSVGIKADIVVADERETGERRKLNLGHTFGHAVEKLSTQYLHGEAVSIGTAFAAEISRKLGLLSDEETNRIKKLLSDLRLPVEADIPVDRLTEAARKDKKRSDDSVRFVLNAGIGNTEVRKMTFEQLNRLLV